MRHVCHVECTSAKLGYMSGSAKPFRDWVSTSPDCPARTPHGLPILLLKARCCSVSKGCARGSIRFKYPDFCHPVGSATSVVPPILFYHWVCQAGCTLGSCRGGLHICAPGRVPAAASFQSATSGLPSCLVYQGCRRACQMHLQGGTTPPIWATQRTCHRWTQVNPVCF